MNKKESLQNIKSHVVWTCIKKSKESVIKRKNTIILKLQTNKKHTKYI